MKAILIAAGLGTRLRPLTNTIPKPMVVIGGKPLLQHHIESLQKIGITDIWVNLHWLPEVVKDYFSDGSKFGVSLQYSFEKELLGSSGALKNPDSAIAQSLKGEPFLVIYADNYTNFPFDQLIDFHNQHQSFMTIGLYHSDEPWTKGIIETDDEGKIVKMVEKPPKEEVTTDQVNAGFYVCSAEVLDYIPEGFSDWGFNIIPNLIKNEKILWGFAPECFVQDTGTLERLEAARRIYESQSH